MEILQTIYFRRLWDCWSVSAVTVTCLPRLIGLICSSLVLRILALSWMSDFWGTLALLNSNLNADQPAMVVASTGRSLVFSQVLVAIRQLFPGAPTGRPIDCMFGAEAQRQGNNKTPTGNKASTHGGSRVTCWSAGSVGMFNVIVLKRRRQLRP